MFPLGGVHLILELSNYIIPACGKIYTFLFIYLFIVGGVLLMFFFLIRQCKSF